MLARLRAMLTRRPRKPEPEARLPYDGEPGLDAYRAAGLVRCPVCDRRLPLTGGTAGCPDPLCPHGD